MSLPRNKMNVFALSDRDGGGNMIVRTNEVGDTPVSHSGISGEGHPMYRHFRPPDHTVVLHSLAEGTLAHAAIVRQIRMGSSFTDEGHFPLFIMRFRVK